ncbi:fasciclin-like arabinogalactan protein 4 [Impatiens glandulifera]|uniref:fasciclin-like arabinogalactan protein 4 n=1 Tax=Impatiens glandulifera TaxID=253017 RepID=UPI001FB08751|nr:fasciclin-like arabinogalactan protein 4 [Impatiens glandulifera]
MANIFSNTHITLTIIIHFLLFSTITAVNITDLLSPFPDLSDFNNLLTTTAVAGDLSTRSSLTILAVPNSYLRSSDLFRRSSSPVNLADVIRYHVLLQYLSWSEIQTIPTSGKLITTLYQTTGRATNNFGSVNITNDFTIRSTDTNSQSNATILTLVKTIPYNFTIFTINSTLIPFGFDLTASETRQSLGINITKALIDGHDFNVAAALLTASGVEQEFEIDEGGAGITIFVPTDEAFSNLPATDNFQSLPADDKAVVLKFHVLHSYYPLGSLESIVNPVQPTLATEMMGAGSFTLNISRVNGSVTINSGIVQAAVTRTVLDQNPLAIFGVSNVLLPREVFGNKPVAGGGSGGGEEEDNRQSNAQPPDVALSPAIAVASTSSSPGIVEEIRSGAAATVAAECGWIICVVWFIGMYGMIYY